MRIANRSRTRGQAMVETILAMVVLLFAVLAVAQFADGLFTKLLLENAAARCARARAVGFNDFMIEKIARLSTMPVSGECLTQNDQGATIGRASRVNRMSDYLASAYDEHARSILDFEYWRDGRLTTQVSGISPLHVSVTQRRPTFFSIADWVNGVPDGEHEDTTITGTFAIEYHAGDYLQ